MRATTTAMRMDWVSTAAALGGLWNAYGVFQFAGSLMQTEASLMAMGMTAAQAALYDGLPAWITVSFGVGVFAGLAGSVLLALRRVVSRTFFAISLVAYVLLFVGDVAYGVFTEMPAQLAILGFVVIIAAGMLWISDRARRQGLLA
jgi:hypothetical protein